MMIYKTLLMLLIPACCMACSCKENVKLLLASAEYEIWLHQQAIDWGHEESYWHGRADAYKVVLMCMEMCEQGIITDN